MFKRLDIKAPKGVNFTREPSQLDAGTWDEAEQVAFRHGITKKVSGWNKSLGVPLSPDNIPVSIQALRGKGGLGHAWTYATKNNKIFSAVNTAAHVPVTPEVIDAVPEEYFWTSDSINSTPYYGYGSYYPWNGIKFYRAKYFPSHIKGSVFRTYKNHIIALNILSQDFDPANPPNTWCNGITDNAERLAYALKFGSWSGEQYNSNALWWSDEIVGGFNTDVSWADADPTSESGWNFLGSSGGMIKDGKTLRDSFIIYREDSVWQMTYIGGVQVFSFKELFNDNGILAEGCVADIGGQHIVVGTSDVYIHNGVQKKTIADGILRKELFQSIDPDYIRNVFISTRYSDKEAWICIPEAGTNHLGHCNVAFVYNWEEATWAKRTMPNSTCSQWGSLNISYEDESWNSVKLQTNSWDTLEGTWTDLGTAFSTANMGMVFGGVDYVDGINSASIFTAIEESQFDGVDFVSTVEKKWLDMGDYNAYKKLCKVYPLVRGGVIKVYVAGSKTVLEAPTWKFCGTYDPESGRMGIATTTTGRFIHIKFEIPEDSRAEIRGYYLEYQDAGVR